MVPGDGLPSLSSFQDCLKCHLLLSKQHLDDALLHLILLAAIYIQARLVGLRRESAVVHAVPNGRLLVYNVRNACVQTFLCVEEVLPDESFLVGFVAALWYVELARVFLHS